MQWFLSPVVWLLRVRNRKGYGVHSPFAFSFLCDVVYERGAYYGYASLARGLGWRQRLRYLSVLKLLLRLSNFWSGRPLVLVGGDGRMQDVCRRYHGQLCSLGYGDGIDSVVHSLGVPVMVVVLDIHKGEGRCCWRALLANDDFTVSFDLYDVGVAFAGLAVTGGHYVVNW